MNRPPCIAVAAALGALCLPIQEVRAQGLGLPRAIDFNLNPRVFETVLFSHQTGVQYKGGKKTRVMLYNGSVPGPTIEAHVGDRLIVHFINLLPEPTTVHWHGLEMPALMDGSHISQPPVLTYGYFRYEFQLNTAGTFWYHPHLNANQQVEKGLYGAVVVRDRRHDRDLRIPRWRERTVFLDDVKLDENNQVAPFGTDPKAKFIPWQRAEDQTNSRLGNLYLVNGERWSKDHIPTMYVLAGAAYRLRFLNVANGRFFRLNISDPRQKWYHIGSDQGLFNEAELIKPVDKVPNPLSHHPFPMSNPDVRLGLLLTPGDRDEVVLLPEGKKGDEFYIEQHDFYRGLHVVFRDPQGNLLFGHDHFDGTDDPINLIRIKIVGTDWLSRWLGRWKPRSPLRYDKVKPLKVNLNGDPLPIFMGHSFPDKVTGDVKFFINVDKPADLLKAVRAHMPVLPLMFGARPYPTLKATDGYHVKVGETRYWEVINFTGSDHNIHTHGFRFQHIDTEYVDLDVPARNYREQPLRLSFEDTIRIPKRSSLVLGRSYSITRLAVQFDDSSRPKGLRRLPKEIAAGGLNPTTTSSGGWVLHCHFLEHVIQGMMSFTQVSAK